MGYTYTHEDEFCNNCKKFVDIFEENYADPSSGLGYSTSGPYCVECEHVTRPVKVCINEMFDRSPMELEDSIPF